MDADRKVNTVVINHCFRSDVSRGSMGMIPRQGREGATRTAEFVFGRLFLSFNA